MTRTLLMLVGAAVVLAACGDSGAPPPRHPVAAPPPPLAVAMPVPSARPRTVAEPTSLTGAQRRADAELVPLAASIVDAYPNGNGFFSSLVANFTRDGKHFVFGSLRDGAPELYLGDVDHPAAAPSALSKGPDRALSADLTIDGKAVLFLRDENGDERHAIWRVNLDGTGLVNLTPGERLRRGQPFLPRGQPNTMFFEVRKENEVGTTFVVQHLDETTPKVVLSQPARGWINSVTADGSRLAIVSFRGFGDAQLLELDVATGKTRALYPPADGRSSIFGAAYAANDKRLFVSTDEGKESSVLIALDAATGKEVARYVSDVPSAAMTFEVAPVGDRIAIRLDLGNHAEVRILDASTLRLVRTVNAPLGEISLGTFAHDGRSFTILASLPNQPADVFAVDTATGAVRPLREDKRAGLDALPPVDASIVIVKAHDGLSLPVNVYLPKGPTSKKLPTLAIFHGGPQVSYAIRWSVYVRFFVSLGYAVIEPNVRGSSGFGRAYEAADNREKRADWMRDLATVNSWAKSQPWCDAERVVVWGQSYGGYTTLMALSRQPTLWRAGVDLYGIADLKQLLADADPNARAVMASEFGELGKDDALIEELSPMRGVDKIARPLFVYAGQNDIRVPRAQSDAIVSALRARGVPVEYMVAANEGHGADHRETKIELMTRTARFLAEALKR